jgi:hypothetical protein
MKKISMIVLVLCILFLAAACKSSAGYGPATLPPWINDIPDEGEIWGIGIAKQSSPAFSMQSAEERGRVAIARQLSSKVEAMFVDYNLDAGNSNSLANTSLQENVSRSITNMNVSGTRPIKRWQAPDGTFYILMALNKADAKAAVASILGNEEALYAQFKAQQALQMLDAQLAKNERPLQINN